MHKILIFIFLLLISKVGIGQNKKKLQLLKPHKLGFLYNYGSEDNFIFNDPDYTYASHTLKPQFFYDLGDWKSLELELVLQPQIQQITHQLINEQFITPDQENYQEKREEFTAKKMMQLYGLEFGLAFSRAISSNLIFRFIGGLGFNYINKRSERLAKGFTFSQNLSIGLSHEIFKKSALFLGVNFGHISNLDFQLPNDGYNILGIEIGYNIDLK